MASRAPLLAILLCILSSCQSVPAERKNNCSCVWTPMTGISEGMLS